MTDHLSTALKYAPIIERVHGSHHSELTRVRELTERIPHADAAETAEIFGELRALTNDFAIPADACEAFTATYESLKSADIAFQERI